MPDVKRVMIIGLDCAEPSLVLGRYRDQLPTLSALADAGAYGRLESVVPPITVPAWSCMMSSRTPGDLGIYGFRNRADHSYDGLFIANGAAVKEPRLWDILGRRGKRSIVLGVPGTFPVKPLNGVMVSCFLTPVDRSRSTRSRRPCATRSRTSSASTSSTARSSAPRTRTTSCARSTR